MSVVGGGWFIVAVVVVASGCGSTKTVTETTTVTPTVTAPVDRPSGLGAPATRVEYGHIAAVIRSGGRYLMRFDPALLLSGETANKAAAQDGAVDPGQPVPNDNYVVDESHRLYTYRVAPDAKITLLVRSTPEKWGPTPVSVASLAQILNGKSAVKLFEQLDSGVWITIRIDTVQAVYQQYRP